LGTACTTTPPPAPASSLDTANLTGSLQLWHHWSDREAQVIQSVVDSFQTAYPGITVTVHDNQDDTKIAQVAASGSDVDVMMISVSNTLGTMCKALVDLQPYMDMAGISASDFQGLTADATTFDGRRCALPTTSDIYGLYYNTDMFAAAGITSPPQTLDELEADGLALTTYNTNGSIKTLGFNPLFGFQENYSGTFAATANVTWMTNGLSSIASDPNWQTLMNWQKAYVDKIGYDKLMKFTNSLGDEWDADNPFQTGKIAMVLDGEWRNAFIEDQAPDLKFATAPFPVLSSTGAQYGASYTDGACIGISTKSKNPDLAWLLVQWISSNTDAATMLANGLKNIPTLKAAASSPNLDVPAQYKTFVDLSQNGLVTTSPITLLGGDYTTPLEDYWDKFQQSDGSGLAAGLAQVDTDINNAMELRSA